MLASVLYLLVPGTELYKSGARILAKHAGSYSHATVKRYRAMAYYVHKIGSLLDDNLCMHKVAVK